MGCYSLLACSEHVILFKKVLYTLGPMAKTAHISFNNGTGRRGVLELKEHTKIVSFRYVFTQVDSGFYALEAYFM